MQDIAKKNVQYKEKVRGERTQVLLYCDNLKTHLDYDIKKIFGDAKIFLCFSPPNMTNFLQPTDAGLGRMVRVAIGNFLDK